jgi:two-component system, chemotaxis family, protein-glutamate methylesterase/glutaminase
MRVLIVDDSVVFRSQIRSALDGHEQVEVAGVANNGRIALQKLAQTTVDLVTLDMEMPEMNGLETIKEIRRLKYPVRIIVFSSHTTRGSEATLEALTAGADDFVTKPSGPDVNFDNSIQTIREELLPKLTQFIEGSKRVTIKTLETKTRADNQTEVAKSTYAKKELATFLPSVVVVGSSTGGPPALEKILTGLAKTTRIPILVAQHMPPVFTASLARRLQTVTGLEVSEGKHNEVVQPGHIYIAPGDFHMTIVQKMNQIYLQLDQGPQRNSVRPAVDPLFESAAKIYGHKTMGVILTGMGEDGLMGCKAIKEAGGGVLIQDKASCVVFGMPGAVFNTGIHDEIKDLNQINAILKRMTA